MKFTYAENIGKRVELKVDDMWSFKAGDVGTIVDVDEERYTVRFDVARNGWEDKALGIPALHGLYVEPKNLRKVK